MLLLTNLVNELHHLILMIMVNVVSFVNWTLIHPESMNYHSMINAMMDSVSMALVVKNQNNPFSLDDLFECTATCLSDLIFHEQIKIFFNKIETFVVPYTNGI